MNAVLLNKQFEVVAQIDNFKSFIWTVRFNEIPDFELDLPALPEIINLYKKGYYIHLEDSDRLMIVDTINYSFSNNESSLIVSGHGLESILERRIVWVTSKMIVKGNVQEIIQAVISQNIISPDADGRKISNFVFDKSTDSRITSLKYEDEVNLTGKTLYEIIHDACVEFDIGFKVTFESDNKFHFSLYAGTDRTYDQNNNLPVIFSNNFGNLISNSYYSSNYGVANAALIWGEDYEYEATIIVGGSPVTIKQRMQLLQAIGDGSTGLDRVEIFVDRTNMTAPRGDSNTTIDQAQQLVNEYTASLMNEGQNEINATKKDDTFDADLEFNDQFKFNVDYFIGDIVEIENELNLVKKVRITEFIRTQDTTGDYLTPSFTVIGS